MDDDLYRIGYLASAAEGSVRALKDLIARDRLTPFGVGLVIDRLECALAESVSPALAKYLADKSTPATEKKHGL